MTRRLHAEFILTFKPLIRLPGFWIPTVVFPTMLYAFFGTQSAGGMWAANAMASFAVYAVLGVGFFQFGVNVAQDRESPFAAWQKSLPGGVANQWIARILASVAFVAVAVAMVVATAFVMTDIEVGMAALASLGLVCLLSAVTATAMGIALGSVASARAAVPVGNLVYLPLAYLGGLWLPPFMMPQSIDAISRWTPTRAMGELGWAAIAGTAWEPRYLILLLAWTLAAATVAFVATSRRQYAF